MSALTNAPKLFSAAFLATALSAVAAGAVTVSLTDTQIMTQNGQDFTFVFTGLAQSDGTGGTLTIANGQSLTNPGPYDGLDIDSQGNSNEFFEVIVEGTSLGTYNCRSRRPHTFIADCSGTVDSKFSLDLNLTSSVLTAALADGTLSVVLAFSDSVNHLNDQDEVITSISYQAKVAAVPVPMSALLLSTGLIGLGSFARRSATA